MSRNLIIGKPFGSRGNYVLLNPDAKETVNPHILVAGTSGAGKTILIKALIGDLKLADKTIVVFDLHGDMETDGENLIEYTPRNSEYGINPFEFDCHLKYGGPHARARMIIVMFKNNFWPGMGPLQEAVLENLLIDTYAYKGIFEDRPETWAFSDNESFPESVGLTKEEAELKRGGPENELPSMEDLRIVYDKVLSYVNNGNAHTIFNLINETYKTKKRIENSSRASEKNKMLLDSQIKNLKEKTELYIEYLTGDKEEFEETIKDNINYEQYNNKTTIRILENLGEYIKKFASMSIFKKNKPKLEKGVNRIALHGFTNEAKPEMALFFIALSIERIFRKCKLRGEYSEYARRKGRDGEKLDMYIVLDESRLVLPNGKEKSNPFNMFNRIALESRKYGLGMILGSQRINHYNDEMLSTMYTKIILKTDESDVNDTLKKLNLKGSDYLSTVNENPGTGMFIQTGKRVKLVKMNSWSNVVENEEYLTEEKIAS